jgi:hypothetical protein
MSTATMTDTTVTPRVDRVRDTMSFSNILTSSASAPCPFATPDVTANGPILTAPEVTSNVPVLASPSTPAKSATAVNKVEETSSPDIVMAEAIDTTEDPDDSPEDDADGEDVPDSEREFICKNDETSRCITGQYTKELSRKVISDHFGRNKACTRDITNWPLFCRKHYQRATYNKQLWQIRKLNLIFRQFDVIEAQFPGTTYDIHFKKSEEARLNEYSRKVASGWSEEAAAKAVAAVQGKHFEAPIEILRELDLDLGKKKTIDEVKEVAEKILKQITDEATLQVPAIEFLPNLPGKTASPKKSTKAPKTPSPKKSPAMKTPTPKGTPGRVSTKGSVKKPGQN